MNHDREPDITTNHFIMRLPCQQSSDVTYRVYDYDRLQDGKPRPLDVKQSIDVIVAPYEQKEPPLNENKSIGNDIKQLASCDLFSVWHGIVDEELTIDQNQPFLLCSVIEGNCILNGNNFSKGTHFILPYNYGITKFTGNAELIFSSL